MSFRRTRVYIAGPILGSGDPYVNVNNAICAYMALLDRGYAPYLPHLNTYVSMAIGHRDVSVWLSLDKAYLSVCDCLLRLSGVSPGSDKEVEWMKELGRQTYGSLDSLVASEPATRIEMLDSELFASVIGELTAAQIEYPPFNSAHEGFAVLKEEVDELWEAVMMKQSDARRPEAMKKEAVQVAAMALRFLKECC